MTSWAKIYIYLFLLSFYSCFYFGFNMFSEIMIGCVFYLGIKWWSFFKFSFLEYKNFVVVFENLPFSSTLDFFLKFFIGLLINGYFLGYFIFSLELALFCISFYLNSMNKVSYKISSIVGLSCGSNLRIFLIKFIALSFLDSKIRC